MIQNALTAAVAVVCWLALPIAGNAQQFAPGDVIVSGTIPLPGLQQFEAEIIQYDRQGQLKTVLVDQSPGDGFTRLEFSPTGVLYTSSTGGIVTVSPTGQITPGIYGHIPYRSLSFAADGTLLAGYIAGILKRFGPSGAVLQSYHLPDDAISIDLAADQCTAYWLGPGIRRFDVCQGTQLPDFTSVDGSDFRLLPAGGVAISRFSTVDIYDANGALLRSIPGSGGALALDPDGTSIWLAEGGSLFKFDMATGNTLIGPIQTGFVGVLGLTVYGEPRAALVNGPLAGIPVLSPFVLLALFAVLAGIAALRSR